MPSTIADVVAAVDLARMTHADQVDKQGEPYIWHVLRVGLAGRTNDEKIVGLLHDTIEDHPEIITLALIEAKFGPVIATAVEAITRLPGEEYHNSYIAKRVAGNALATPVKLRDSRDHLGRMQGLPEDDRKFLSTRYRRVQEVLLPLVVDQPW